MAANNKTPSNDAHNKNDVSERKTIITDKLSKRDEERHLEILRKRAEKELTTDVKESANYFTECFSQEKSSIETELKRSDSLDKTELTTNFDDISVSIQKLRKFLADSTMFLPSYQVRQAQESLSKLQNDLTNKIEDKMPKKRFAFKGKKKGDKTSEEGVVPSKSNEKLVVKTIELAECRFIDAISQNLSKESNEINQKDVALARLTDCTVRLYGAPSAIHINKLTNCTVLCGPVSGSVFISECTNTVFILACQQLRVHETYDSQFYIHVTSRAIIEDTTRVKFAPYNWNYENLNQHFELSGLDKNKNNWNDIDDFNWLASDSHSPNWSILEKNERKSDWN